MFNFHIFLPSEDESFCCIEDRPGVLEAKGWRINKGRRMDQRYPADVKFHMGRSTRGIKIPDIIDNFLGYLMVSQRLKNILKKEIEQEVEFLPFTLINHKGRIASESCFIVNLIGTLDCVDLSKTEGREFKAVPGTFREIHRLSLHYDKIPSEYKVFRVPQMPTITIIRNDLKKVFEQSEIVGMDFVGIGESCRIS